MSPEEKYYARKRAIRGIDKVLNRVKKREQITAIFNISTARHTWATLLLRHNVSLVYISRGLGHTSLKTTENYIANFNDDLKKEYGILLQNIRNDMII
ncbi:tyrosine-type recombinase/integrase [Alistipes sp. OttesenSCG-928-B03]|nr:tyrosine-type recombinase/integrase [Alistipes sp. OttesenSCG-928-B03]